MNKDKDKLEKAAQAHLEKMCQAATRLIQHSTKESQIEMEKTYALVPGFALK